MYKDLLLSNISKHCVLFKIKIRIMYCIINMISLDFIQPFVDLILFTIFICVPTLWPYLLLHLFGPMPLGIRLLMPLNLCTVCLLFVRQGFSSVP